MNAGPLTVAHAKLSGTDIVVNATSSIPCPKPKRGLSPGSIILLCTVLPYGLVVAATAGLAVYKKMPIYSTLQPHTDFWKAFVEHARQGVSVVVLKLKGIGGNRGTSYETV